MMWHPDMPDEYKNQIVTGDARVLAERIPDESIDLIFTDPVYDRIDDYRWLAETAARVLKPDRWCCAYYGIGYLPETTAAMSCSLTYEWHHVHYMPTLNARGAYKTFSNYRGLLRYMKGRAIPRHHLRDLQTDAYAPKNNGHEWAKNEDVITAMIGALAQAGSVVLDLFCGKGATLAACSVLGLLYIAFEIDPITAELARERVRNTQPPLFVLEPQQLELIPS
jgi:DNA modification methylase